MSVDCSDLIGELYEAAFLPDRWPAVLSSIGARIGSSTCTLTTADGGPPHWVCPPDVAPVVEEYFASGWAERNDRVAMTARERRFGCVRDIDIWTREEIAALPVVEQFLRPRGFGWGAAILTAMPTGETLMLSVERRWEAGPVPDAGVALLHALQPHLMRSALLSTKLLFERAHAAVETFGLAAIPAAIVRASGAVIAANRRFEELGGQLRIGPSNLLRPVSPRVAALLEAALCEPGPHGRPKAPRSIAVPAHGEEERPLVLHVLPVEGRARDLFGAAMALLIVTRIATPRAPSTSLLEALFDLTRAEARVAQALLAGGSTEEIADGLGIRRETARNHLKAILRKTGFSRRMDLARFLSGVAVFDSS